jgi:Flp pilus assembly protein TadD
MAATGGVPDAVRELKSGQPGQAEILLRKILAQEAENAEAWKWLGVVYASQSRHDAAEQPFREACRLAPEDTDACYYLGRNLFAQNRFEPALPVLMQTLQTGAKKGRTLLALAQSLEALDRREEAERRFHEAIDASRTERPSPQDEPALHYGVFLIRQGRTEKAAQVLRNVVKRVPSARAHFELGRAWYQSGQLSAAIGELKQAVKLDPNYGAAHLLLGKAYARSGRSADAERHTETGRKLVKAHEQ